MALYMGSCLGGFSTCINHNTLSTKYKKYTFDERFIIYSMYTMRDSLFVVRRIKFGLAELPCF